MFNRKFGFIKYDALKKHADKGDKYSIDEIEDLLWYLEHPGRIFWGHSNFNKERIVRENLNFNFYLNSKFNVYNIHNFRFKLCVEGNRKSSVTGYLEVNGSELNYIHGYGNAKPSKGQLKEIKSFLIKYRSLILAIWEGYLYVDDFKDYLEGKINWENLMVEFGYLSHLKRKIKKEIKNCLNLTELENIINKYNLFTMEINN